MSRAARAAWDRRFGTRQIELKKRDPQPFGSVRRLGNGGWGFVDEISIDGLAVALKRTFTAKLTANAKRELEVLRHVSRKTHRHLVELVGSYIYTEKRQGSYELGIAIWPVARCDLSQFLSEVAVLRQWLDGSVPEAQGEDSTSVIETLASIAVGHEWSNRHELYALSLQRLGRCFGCIATAVAWLHNEAHIRHRDLKPAQILLSHDGLWVTDFGLASFIPDLENTATSGMDSATRRYQAPERAHGLRRGRCEDVFGLGCMYLEMSYVLLGIPREAVYLQKMKEGWSYQANVREDLDMWLMPLRRQSRVELSRLADLVGEMLSFDMDRRPDMALVVSEFSRISSSNIDFFDHCCQNSRFSNPATLTYDPDIVQYHAIHRENQTTTIEPFSPSVGVRSKSTNTAPLYRPGNPWRTIYPDACSDRVQGGLAETSQTSLTKAVLAQPNGARAPPPHASTTGTNPFLASAGAARPRHHELALANSPEGTSSSSDDEPFSHPNVSASIPNAFLQQQAAHPDAQASQEQEWDDVFLESRPPPAYRRAYDPRIAQLFATHHHRLARLTSPLLELGSEDPSASASHN